MKKLLLSISIAFITTISHAQLGVGTYSFSPTASLHVIGTGTTSATYGLKIFNSTPTPVFSVRDDRKVSINGDDLLFSTSAGVSYIDLFNYNSLTIKSSALGGINFITLSNTNVNVTLHRPTVISSTYNASGQSTLEIGAITNSLGTVSSVAVGNVSLGAAGSGLGMMAIGAQGNGGTYGSATMRFLYDPVQFGGSISDHNNNYYKIGIGTNAISTARVAIADGLAVTTGNVGIGTTSPSTLFALGGTDAVMTVNESSNTPADPSSGSEARMYVKNDKLIIQYNDGGTVRYKYLDLTGTGVTWTHSTSAP